MAIRIQPVSIEPMRATDLDDVARIDALCFPAPWLRNAYTTELGNPAATYLVARVDGGIVGYGGVWVIAREAHITTLAIMPEHRGRKIGERLLIALLEEGRYRGGVRASLEVRESNRIARSLYRKYGFYEAALRKSYYTDNGENAVVMWADGIGGPPFLERLRELKAELDAAYGA